MAVGAPTAVPLRERRRHRDAAVPLRERRHRDHRDATRRRRDVGNVYHSKATALQNATHVDDLMLQVHHRDHELVDGVLRRPKAGHDLTTRVQCREGAHNGRASSKGCPGGGGRRVLGGDGHRDEVWREGDRASRMLANQGWASSMLAVEKKAKEALATQTATGGM